MIEVIPLALILGTFLGSPAAMGFIALGLAAARAWLLAHHAAQYGAPWSDGDWALQIGAFFLLVWAGALVVRWLHAWRVRREGRE